MPSWCLPSHLKNERDSFETNLDIISKEKKIRHEIMRNLFFLQIVKDQLISKGLFDVFNSSKNERKHIDLRSNFFINFLEEFKTSKSPFEIN